jgi:lysophospholipase L1-like esterase
MSKVPTFFTNWIGANDVLAYATSGGAQSDGVTPAADHNSTGNMNPVTYGGNDITNSDVFASVYSTIVTTLTSGGAKGVVATVPSVTSIPYFTSVPFNPLTAQSIGKGLAPAGSDTATQIAYGTAAINQANAQLYGPLDGVFSAYGEPNRVNLLSTTSANPILIYDADATDRSAEITGALSGTLGVPTATAFGMVFGKARQATAADLVVLTANEKAKVANATAAYNAAIVSIANANDIAVADMNAIMNQLITGLRIETGQLYTANYFSGSATEGVVLFSLDGVHPNARGYAVIANEFIKVINEFYNANLPLHNPSYFPGINIVPSN